jgi:hypothetical protein
VETNHRRVASVALAAALLVLGLTAVAAPAHKSGAGSYLELNPYGLSDTVIQYSGRVNSAAKACRARRPVDLYVGGILLATVRTDRSGAWSLTGARPPQGTEVTAKIRRKVKRSKRHRHKCGGDSISKKAQ